MSSDCSRKAPDAVTPGPLHFFSDPSMKSRSI